MPDIATPTAEEIAFDEWRAAITIPPYVQSTEEGAQRMLHAPFENFLKVVFLAGWAAKP